MDLAKTLVRAVVRAFCSTQEVLVVDALVTHVAMIDSDMSKVMKMNMKDLHKLCAGLRDQRLLIVHVRPELLEGRTRPVNRTWYYIDYRQSVDAIKWRLYRCDKDMQTSATPATESKDYFCPVCKAEWTQMEVLDSFSADGFLCHRCGNVLTHVRGHASPGHQQSARMNNQFKFMTDLLPQIDGVVVPECTFDQAFAERRPVVNDAPHEVRNSTGHLPADAIFKPTAVKGLANTGPKTMQVTISDDNERQIVEDRKRKERLLRENALPTWITESSVPTQGTVFNSSIAGARDDDLEEAGGAPAKRLKVEHVKEEPVKAEQPEQKKVKDEPAEDEDDEDDLEFENVM